MYSYLKKYFLEEKNFWSTLLLGSFGKTLIDLGKKSQRTLIILIDFRKFFCSYVVSKFKKKKKKHLILASCASRVAKYL